MSTWYNSYLKSDHWQQMRREARERDDQKCVLCFEDKRLEVHHMRYGPDLRALPLSAVITLCDACHEMVHRYIKSEVGRMALDEAVDDERRLRLIVIFRGRFMSQPKPMEARPECMGDKRRRALIPKPAPTPAAIETMHHIKPSQCNDDRYREMALMMGLPIRAVPYKRG